MKYSPQSFAALLLGFLAVAAPQLVYGAAQAAPLKFDFGPADSPVFPGFTRVSNQTSFAPGTPAAGPQAPVTAFGFDEPAPQAFDRLRPNALECDFVWSATKSTFHVALPNGRYKAWMLYGDSRYATRVITPLALKNQVEIDGKTVLSDPINGWREFYSEKYFFRNASSVWHAKDVFYDKYVSPNFKDAAAEFEVTQGRANFVFEDIPLCALMIYRADEAPQAEEEIAYLRGELRRYTVIRELKPENLNPEPAYPATSKQRGYVTYTRSLSTPPIATDKPLPGEIDQTVEASLSANQKATLNFTVLPLRDLKNVKVSCSDLVQKETNATIPADSVKVEFIRHHEISRSGRSSSGSTAYVYRVDPYLLMPYPQRFDLMEEGINRTILLTVAADETTRPGTYEGVATVQPENGPEKKVPLRVRVLPIALPPLPIPAGRYHADFDFQYYYYWSKTFKDPEFLEYAWQMEKRNLQWTRDIGLTSVAYADDIRGDILDNPARVAPDGRFVRWMDLYRDMGFREMPWYGFNSLSKYLGRNYKLGDIGPAWGPVWNQKYREIITSVRDLGKQRGWPEVLIYPSDELSNYGEKGTEEGLNRLAASSGISGVRRIISVNGKYEYPLIDKVEIIMPNYGFPISPQTLGDIKAKKTELWLYNVMDTRFTWGYYPYLTKAKGRFQWYNNNGASYPYDDFDSNYGDSLQAVCIAGPNGPISFVSALDMRAGLDDLRYVTLLESLAAKARDQNGKAVLEARAILAELDAMDPDLRHYAGSGVDARETGFDANAKMWNSDKCEQMRQRIVQSILQLQNEK